MFTDGACEKMGTPDAVAGIGVHFPESPNLDISAQILGGKTNNHAEFSAIIKALQQVGSVRPTVVCSDSQYCLDCITKWYFGW